MNNLTFEIEDNNLFLIQNKTSFLSLFDQQSKTPMSSLGFFHCYHEELIKYGIIDAYLANPTMPVVWLSTYDHAFIAQIVEYKKPTNCLAIDLCQEMTTGLNFEKNIDNETRQKIVDNCNNNGLSIITTSADIGRYNDQTMNQYELLFLNYLQEIESLSKQIPKTIFVVKFEEGVLSHSQLTTLHESIRNIKNNGHIVIFNFHCYGDISGMELNLFSEDLYENYLVSTMGASNNVLSDFPNKNLYKYLPEQLKTFLTDPTFKNYNKHSNYYHKQHRVSVINDFNKIVVL
jgi:hypothetical protein